jgi:5'-deoxy-5'-methylthioadenosine phosphorylase
MKLAIIGGTGLARMDGLEVTRREVVHTPYGEPSAPLTHGKLEGSDVVFLPRHGSGHTIPPHQINYRANIWAIRHLGVDGVVAIAATGGIREDMAPGTLAIPDQLIDYTWGRGHTFYEHDLAHVTHVDFTDPYCKELREALIQSGRKADLDLVEGGTYGVTQGPRLETAREVQRLKQDGCDLVGMTAMPEAGLARELDLCYVTCSVVANWAAGLSGEPITMEGIQENLLGGMSKVERLLRSLLQERNRSASP